MNIRRFCFLAIFLALAPQTTAFGWGTSGHRIVGAIGQAHLSDAALARVREIAGDRSLDQIATWPDFIRSESSWNCSQPWHFLTVEDGEAIATAIARKGEFRNCRLPTGVSLPQNVVQAIDFFSKILSGDASARAAFVALADSNSAEFYDGSAELSALSFLVHLIGDVHQPLHVGRGNDLGGNRVAVNWFDEPSNLHSSWDSGLIESENLSYTEFVAFLEAEEGAELELGNLTDTVAWAQESKDVRFEVYEIYGSTSRENRLPDLKYQYAHDQLRLLKERLYKGGRRLSARLSSLFD